MAMFQRHFTLEEANELIPWLQETLASIHTIQRALTGTPEYEDVILHPHFGGNGKAKKYAEIRQQLQEMQDLIDSIVGNGIVIQDLDRGLVDFPSWLEGEEVFLCYELADGDAIVAWHSLDGGFAGRRPLDDE